MNIRRLESLGRWLFTSNAIINWLVSIRGIIDPSGYLAVFGGESPAYPSLVRLWMGFVFMYGCMFWETSRDLRGKVALVKYNLIEKSITAVAITSGYLLVGDTPARGMVFIVITNWLWIPALLYFDVRWRRALRTS